MTDEAGSGKPNQLPKHLRGRVRKELLVKPGSPARLTERDPGWTDDQVFQDLSAKELKDSAREYLALGVKELATAQALLWASDTYALLVVFQGMDASGKDSAVKHVMSGVNPQGVEVTSFKSPSSEELGHDFLWRIAKAVPERGRIGIFNRSHYEEVGAVRVHPEWLAKQKLPPERPTGKKLWKERFEQINAFEQHLYREGTRIVKIFLHVSKEEQKKRFLTRLNEPAKRWKFNPADVTERARWDEYMEAYDEAITATSTEYAPWYVVPADHKPVAHALVASILLDTIEEMALRFPEPTPEEAKELEEARKTLGSERESTAN